MFRLLFQVLMPLAAIAAAPQARAATPVELSGDVKVEKTIVENGTEKKVLIAPDVVVPGDKLLFTTKYRNAGQTAVENFVVTSPVPAAVLLMDDAASPFEVSVDGGKVWGKLAALTVAQANGNSRPATSADVTHVRWTIRSIAAGAEGSVQYRATVR